MIDVFDESGTNLHVVPNNGRKTSLSFVVIWGEEINENMWKHFVDTSEEKRNNVRFFAFFSCILYIFSYQSYLCSAVFAISSSFKPSLLNHVFYCVLTVLPIWRNRRWFIDETLNYEYLQVSASPKDIRFNAVFVCLTDSFCKCLTSKTLLFRNCQAAILNGSVQRVSILLPDV